MRQYRESDGLVKRIAEIREFRPSADDERSQSKSELRRQHKATLKRELQRLKEIEAMFEKPSQLLGTKRALQTYRALLTLSADPNARDNILKLTPRELARRDLNANFASEIIDVDTKRQIETVIDEMERETKEAPTRSTGSSNAKKGSVKNWIALRERAKRVAAHNSDYIHDSFWHLHYVRRDCAIEKKCSKDCKAFLVGKQSTARYDGGVNRRNRSGISTSKF